MSTEVIYNNITLEMCNFLHFAREPQLDGPTYLWTRVHFVVRGVYSPSQTAYTVAGAAPGTLAPTTDAAVIDALMTPHKVVLAKAGGVTLVKAPAGGAECDANQGPRPIACRVAEFLGDRTFIVEWEVECFVINCNEGNLLLSHRWSAFEDIKLDGPTAYLATRRVEGWAQLRADLVIASDIAPDEFRAALLHDVPHGYQRQNIKVSVGPDIHALVYSFEDVQKPFGPIPLWRDQGVMKVEAFHTAQIAKMPTDKVAGEIMASIGRGLGGIARVTAELGPVSGWGAVAAIPMMGVAAMLDLSLTVINLVPRAHHSVVVRVWGDVGAYRGALETFAGAMAMFRILSTPGASIALGGVSYRVTHDLMNEWVEVQIEYQEGFEAIFRHFDPNPFTAVRNVARSIGSIRTDLMPLEEEVAGFTAENVVHGEPHDGARPYGRKFLQLLAQTLQDPCELPDEPINIAGADREVRAGR